MNLKGNGGDIEGAGRTNVGNGVNTGVGYEILKMNFFLLSIKKQNKSCNRSNSLSECDFTGKLGSSSWHERGRQKKN